VSDYLSLPEDLPVPEDDGAADHLVGTAMPHVALASTGRSEVALDELGPGRTVLYVYPLSGKPGVDLPDGWDSIPGARGCTPEACAFRDHYAELQAAGASAVYGLSSQSTEYQAELAERLGLPFEILSDEHLQLVEALRLPTFTAGGELLYKRLTMVVTAGRIEHVFYPIFPPNEHAGEVLGWLSNADAQPIQATG
jgi:peroxiredoxin